MRHSVCATAILAAAVALGASATREPPCQFSGGLGPDAACTQSRDDDDVTSPWLWPGDDGFGMGFGTPGYGWP
ncbi:hypothetical protein [Mycobacteroides immunogenum]|uniref:hypothetical protein n=1 Tax=Mycobacteroides immunogenum TaxID=83262 RepID=UPI000A45FDC7|nr:hypothetical protein [Mycobacteroides immunogenum]MCV7308973.1 hypothetical protein [Mycobacteroides immunogenum]